MNNVESMERQIVEALVTEAFKQGFTKIIINNGGEPDEHITCTSIEEVMASMRQTDEEYLYFVHPDVAKMPCVYLVYGNDGYDVIADHSSSLNEMIDTIQPLIDTLEAQFHGV